MSDEEDEYRVNAWYKTEVDVNVTAESEEEAIEKAREKITAGMGVSSSPTEDDILSEQVVGIVDGGHIVPTAQDD